MELKKLQNGSDIRGIGSASEMGSINLTDEAVSLIAGAFAKWLKDKTNKQNLKIAVGRDSRLSGPRIADAVTDALLKSGVDVYYLGLASTPAMFMTTVTQGYLFDGAIMITASHLPWNRNGLKFFTKDGGLDKADIAKLIEIAESGMDLGSGTGTVKNIDFMSVYAKHLADKVRSATGEQLPLKGMKIVVDAGNGAGGFYAKDVLEALGADTSGSRFLQPDGNFPNHIPNPEDKEAMRSITEAVLENNADFGIIFDTDVDRAGAVDSNGKPLNRNRLIALISEILLEEHPGTTIVTDSVTSSGLKDFISSRGGVHHRFMRGYKNVINEAIRLNEEGCDAQLAIETSGHAALKENYFLDDGAYLVTKLIIKLANLRKQGKSISDLISDLKEPAEATEIRLKITDEDFKAAGQKVLDGIEQTASQREDWQIAPDNREGVRVSVLNGWFLIRLSLHDPLLPINIESDSIGDVKKIEKMLAEELGKYEGIDISPIAIAAK